MARLARCEIFDPREVAVLHVMNRVCWRCYLLGNDPISGKSVTIQLLGIDIG